MTPDEEYAFYGRPENQEPQGPGRRGDGTRLSAPVPVRFPPELLEQARRAACRNPVMSWCSCPPVPPENPQTPRFALAVLVLPHPGTGQPGGPWPVRPDASARLR